MLWKIFKSLHQFEVITFYSSSDIQEYYEEILRDVHRSPAQVQREAAILAKKWENVSLEEKIRSVEEIMSRISETGSPTNGVSTCDSNLEITSNGVSHIKVKTDDTKMPSQYDTGVPRIFVDSQKTITTPIEVPLKETFTDKSEMTDITSGGDISIADEKLDLPRTENIQSVSDDGSLTDSYEELVLQANDQEKH